MKKILTYGLMVIAVAVVAYAAYTEYNNPGRMRLEAMQAKTTFITETIALEGKIAGKNENAAVLECGGKQAAKCFKGMEVAIKIKDRPIGFRGKVEKIIRLKDGTCRIKVPIQNLSLEIQKDEPVVATLYTKNERTIMAVPAASIDRRGESGVWVVDVDDTVYRVPVRVDAYDSNIAAVTGDIEDGDWIVLSPPEEIEFETNPEIHKIY